MDSLQINEQAGKAVLPAPDTRKRGISGGTLKIIAIVTMFIDHVGAALLGRFLMASGYMEAALSQNVADLILWLEENAALYLTYTAMRMIGRIAFPIFCFLLIEGFQKTHDVKKYALRLGIFALISEIPFDLAFNAQVLEFSYQNVFFTLFFLLLAMLAYDKIWKAQFFSGKAPNLAAKLFLSAAALLVCCGLAEALKTDYAAIGVLCITVMYAFRKKKAALIAAGCVAFAWEVTAPLAFLPIGFYNGQRGLKLKYIFYLFYPLHLLLIYGISLLLGVAGYAVV